MLWSKRIEISWRCLTGLPHSQLTTSQSPRLNGASSPTSGASYPCWSKIRCSHWTWPRALAGFVQAWDQVQKHLRELERGPGSSIITLRKSDLSSHQSEDAPPVKPSFRAMARASMETFCTASVVDKAFLFYEGLKRQPVALAVALCTYGILLKVWPSDSLQGVFGNMLLALSVYVLAWQICNVGVHKAALTADSVGHQVGSFKPWLEGLARDAGAATGDMTQSLGDRLAAALDKAVGNLKALVTVF